MPYVFLFTSNYYWDKALLWGLDDFQQEDQTDPQKCQATREFPKLIDNSWSYILAICALRSPTHTQKGKEWRVSTNHTFSHWTLILSTLSCYLLFLQDPFGMLVGLLMLQAILRCEGQEHMTLKSWRTEIYVLRREQQIEY